MKASITVRVQALNGKFLGDDIGGALKSELTRMMGAFAQPGAVVVVLETHLKWGITWRAFRGGASLCR
jgi:hypothetical protein